jgi:hypothetical protein
MKRCYAKSIVPLTTPVSQPATGFRHYMYLKGSAPLLARSQLESQSPKDTDNSDTAVSVVLA